MYASSEMEMFRVPTVLHTYTCVYLLLRLFGVLDLDAPSTKLEPVMKQPSEAFAG